MIAPRLEELAQRFAVELTDTVRCVAPDAEPFGAVSLGTRVVISQQPKTGIVLSVDEQPFLSLIVDIKLELDSTGTYLAVERSAFRVYPEQRASKEPLFRFEYERRPTGVDLPGAHLHVHAHRDAAAYIMGRAGRATRRARDRAESDSVPRLSEIHLPIGGSRFRPCLEDVLEMLICELGVDHSPDARDVLRAGRERWRRMQIGSSVRDAPVEAARTLEEMGYRVEPPGDGHPSDRLERLREL